MRPPRFAICECCSLRGRGGSPRRMSGISLNWPRNWKGRRHRLKKERKLARQSGLQLVWKCGAFCAGCSSYRPTRLHLRRRPGIAQFDRGAPPLRPPRRPFRALAEESYWGTTRQIDRRGINLLWKRMRARNRALRAATPIQSPSGRYRPFGWARVRIFKTNCANLNRNLLPLVALRS